MNYKKNDIGQHQIWAFVMRSILSSAGNIYWDSAHHHLVFIEKYNSRAVRPGHQHGGNVQKINRIKSYKIQHKSFIVDSIISVYLMTQAEL